MTGNPLPPKKEVALALLERGSVHVHLDPRAAGVVVPAWFKRQPQLVLQVGLNMPVPIPDLRVDEDGMSCTLSFNRSPFFCIVPWSSVYAMVGDDGRGMVWPEDVPPEVALQARTREGEPAAKKAPTERPLAVVRSPVEPVRRPAPTASSSAKSAAKPRAIAGAKAAPGASEKSETAKSKKPRTRKGSEIEGVVVEAAKKAKGPKAVPNRAPNPPAQGVLIPIPAATKKSSRRGSYTAPTHEPSPAPAAAPARTSPRGVPQPDASVRPNAAPAARPERSAPSAPLTSVGDPSPRRQPAQPPPPPAAEPTGASRPTAPHTPNKPTAGKPKREIPPYLRVVK